MVEPKKLSLQDVREIAKSISYGYPRVEPALHEKHPWIKEYSQEAVREIYGDHFPVWNYQRLPVFADIWEGPVQPVTTNPKRMWYLMAGDRTYQWGLTMKSVQLEQVVMRYELTPERVLVYMPMLIQAILDMSGDSLKHWKISGGGMSLHKVFETSLNEDEDIIADLSGLTPSLMDFRIGKTQWKELSRAVHLPEGAFEWFPKAEEVADPGAKPGEIWWWNKKLVHDIVRDYDDPGPDAYALDLISRGQIAPNEEWTQERVVEYFREIYRKVGDFMDF